MPLGQIDNLSTEKAKVAIELEEMAGRYARQPVGKRALGEYSSSMKRFLKPSTLKKEPSFVF